MPARGPWLHAWTELVRPARLITVYLLLLALATAVLGAASLGGLFERLLGFTAAGAVVFLALAIRQRG